jgi:SpoVK/Ycf46/Vps4 family AAA+-type ATPase
VTLPIPDAASRRRLWKRALRRAEISAKVEWVDRIAQVFPLHGGAIAQAAQRIARASANAAAPPGFDLAAEAARAALTARLSNLANRSVTTLTWDDLVVSEELRDQLREIARFGALRRKVFDDWGFGEKLPYGRGITALFHGPPGTGKTMAAGIIAADLGMELFKVDLSRLVSKYVGDTEKNLGRIFDEAEASQSVLLFDEADSLFGSRTTVKSAVDRYANLEVNYLLERMERFEGVTVLTTNFEDGIDDAFRRRLRFRIAFGLPTEQERVRMWATMLPSRAAVSGDVKCEELGKQFDLAGGHIKNAVLRAAFAAAERGGSIEHADLLLAATRECRETGRLVRSSAS